MSAAAPARRCLNPSSRSASKFPKPCRARPTTICAGAHMVVGLARQGFGNFDAERDEGFRHLLAGAAADIEDTSRREQALERARDPRRIDAGPPARHAVEPHADGASRFPPLDFRHASFLPSKIADEVLVLWRIAQVDEGARGTFHDLPRRGGIAGQRAKCLAAALRAGSDQPFYRGHRLYAPTEAPSIPRLCAMREGPFWRTRLTPRP